MHNPADNDGDWVVERVVTADAPLDEEALRALEEGLMALDGVCSVRTRPGHRQVRLRYDLTRLQYDDLLARLHATGIRAADGLWPRLRSWWYRTTDQIGRENAALRPGPCCNRPPKGSGGQRH